MTKQRLVGAGLTISAMRDLGNKVASFFLEQGVPVVPLQSSALFPVERDHSLLPVLLKSGAVPLLNGDVVVRGGRTGIMSGDEQVVALAKKVHPWKIIFLTDVDGVFRQFPPRGGAPLRTMTRKDVAVFVRRMKSRRTSTDVTGGMAGKLAALLGMRNVLVTVCNGKKSNALSRAINGSVGTVLQL